MSSAVSSDIRVITDVAEVPAELIEQDRNLAETIKTAQGELDRLRWEATSCPQAQTHIAFKTYGEAVGRGDKAIRESAKAWESHGLGCTDPSHGGAEPTPEIMPDAESHEFARFQAAESEDTVAAVEAIQKSGASGRTANSIRRREPEKVAEVRRIAKEKAAAAAVVRPDQDMYDAAARELARRELADVTLRQSVKKQLMENRGELDFKAVSAELVDEIIGDAERRAATPSVVTGEKPSFEDALKQVLEHDAARVRAEKDDAMKDRKQKLLVHEFGRLLIHANLKLSQAAGVLKQIEVKGVTPAQKDRIEGNVARARYLLNLLEMSVVALEPVDWDAAFAELAKMEFEESEDEI